MRKLIGKRILILVVAVVSLAPRLFAEVASFYIESISVSGASRGAAEIVRAESHLRQGAIYDENQLRDAMSRIRRLPFVISTSFRLGKGSSVDKYVLIITVRQSKPLFAIVDSKTHWEESERFDFNSRPPVRVRELDQTRGDQLVIGGRMFIGRKGMLNLAGERVTNRNDRYTLSFSQYDLFGTRASITGVASYLLDPGAFPNSGPGARIDWHHRDNFTWEVIGVVPFSANDSIRGSWQRSERPIRYFEVLPGGQLRYILRSLPEIRRDLFWLHDTTNDPLFPTAGTRFTVGAARTSTPSSGFTTLGRTNLDETRASLERSWSLTPSQAITWGGSYYTSNHKLERDRLFSRYSLDLWGRERTIRLGDLHLEVVLDYERDALHQQFANSASDRSSLQVGIVHRSVWGVVRLTGEYARTWRSP